MLRGSDLLGSGVPTTAWLKCSVGTSLDWFCHVYKLIPVKHKKTVLSRNMEKEINAKFKVWTLLCLNYPDRITYINIRRNNIQRNVT